MLTVTPVPAFDDNYIWVIDDHGAALVVDPGDAQPVLQHLDATGHTLAGILVTHHHRDHTGGLATLARRCASPVYGPGHLSAVTHPVSDGDTLDIAALDVQATVRATPGHTLDHLAYYVANHLFCGDTLFGAGCGRLFEGSPAQMVASFAALLAFPDATRLCPAHEYTLDNLAYALGVDADNPALHARLRHDQACRDDGRPTLPSTLALERATNPFLRTDSRAVSAVIHGDLGRPPRDPAEAFGVLRAHKDRWDRSH